MQTAAAEPVDLALVLAVDVSASVDYDEFALMIGGLASAFRSGPVVQALLAGPRASIAVAVLFWSSAVELAVGWTRIAAPGDAARLADAIESAPRQPLPAGTALGDGLVASLALLGRCPHPAARKVIDVSGDGRANQGVAVQVPRLAAELSGVGINGLAVVNEEPDLLAYYLAEVVAGLGSFAMEARDYADFAHAIQRKLIREAGPGPLIADQRAGMPCEPMRPGLGSGRVWE